MRPRGRSPSPGRGSGRRSTHASTVSFSVDAEGLPCRRCAGLTLSDNRSRSDSHPSGPQPRFLPEFSLRPLRETPNSCRSVGAVHGSTLHLLAPCPHPHKNTCNRRLYATRQGQSEGIRRTQGRTGPESKSYNRAG
jgi:hypothetical protein